MPDFGRWNANGGDPSLNEINRTDQFLDALASQQPPYSTDRGDAELAYLLAGWRDDVRETPMGSVLTTEEAAAALDQATSPGRRRRLSLAVVGSAAAAVLCLGGFGAVVAGSGPGDALYGLRSVLFGEQTQARDDAVALAAETEMQQVQRLIEQGDWQGAQAKLQAVTTTVATVGDDQRKAELVSQWRQLTVKVDAPGFRRDGAPGRPAAHVPVDQRRPEHVLAHGPDRDDADEFVDRPVVLADVADVDQRFADVDIGIGIAVVGDVAVGVRLGRRPVPDADHGGADPDAGVDHCGAVARRDDHRGAESHVDVGGGSAVDERGAVADVRAAGDTATDADTATDTHSATVSDAAADHGALARAAGGAHDDDASGGSRTACGSGDSGSAGGPGAAGTGALSGARFSRQR